MTNSDITAAYYGVDPVNKIYLGDELVWPTTPPDPYLSMPLTFDIISGGSIGLASTFNTTTRYRYQINDGEILTGSVTTAYTYVNLNEGDTIKIWGERNGQNGGLTVRPDNNSYFNIYGNVGSLVENYNFHTGIGLGLEGKHVINAENLVMPIRDFDCYHLFSGCTDLIAAPKTVVCLDCREMFAGCTSLTTPPELPETVLRTNCYSYMFKGCTSLTTAPELPATILTNNCYSYMFEGCTSLTSAPVLPATTLKQACYSYMFNGCTSLTNAPVLPATTLADSCYKYMFKGCSSLTTAPELNAPQIRYRSYVGMFQNCTSLNYVKCLATYWAPDDDLTDSWLSGVAATGTFVKYPNAEWRTDLGGDSIPTGWTVQDATI